MLISSLMEKADVGTKETIWTYPHFSPLPFPPVPAPGCLASTSHTETVVFSESGFTLQQHGQRLENLPLLLLSAMSVLYSSPLFFPGD